ncbi:uncharacterized protein LOC128682111 isoform X2 [Plodia interpunctella]|uniref:uncharacterized protein LOC128682111 isoform X2 n=1 Tax=Plodia interpunctella TaxID=58824 RepID=UPI002368ABFB|nr:uncharacterized protein LOC128682111 isoform X2 [Plodia interpunctella]
MALRTTLCLVLVCVCVFSDVKCDVELKLNYDIDEVKASELLRGSGENEELKDIQTQIKTLEANKEIVDENEETDKVTESTTVDDAPSTTENLEALPLSDIIDDVKENESITTTEVDVDTTLSMIDNNVYKGRDNIEDIYSNGRFNVRPDTTVFPTTRSVDTDGVVPRIAELDEEIDMGQRSPKTENSGPKPPVELRSYEKPHPPPAVSKSTTLRSWLEDSWLRPPAGILVPLRPMALTRALAVWNDLVVDGLNLTDIIIVGYDSNGVNWRSRHSLQPSTKGMGDRTVSEALSKLLLKYQEVNTDVTTDGTMRALTSAAKLVPYDSALFVVTDKGAGDSQRLPLALRALVEKRLKVYTIWTDPGHPSQESEMELQVLRNVSRHTEGDVLPYSLQVMDMESSSNLASDVEQWDPVEMLGGRKARLNTQLDVNKFETLLVKRGGGKAISLGMPVESGVSALRIYIEGAVEHAVLYPPNDGPQIDLYNSTSVASFSPASKSEGQSPRDVYLVFPGADPDEDMLSVIPATPTSAEPDPMVGLWHLSLRCDTCDFRLCVAARARLRFDVETVALGTLKLRVSGPVASVRESSLIDEYGTELAKLPFSYQPMTTDGHEAKDNPVSEVVAEVNLPAIKGSKTYVKIVGRDVQGEPFVRLAGPLNQQSEIRTSRSASIVFPENNVNDLERAEEDGWRVYNEKLLYNDSNVLPFSRAVSQVVNQRGSLLTAVQIGLSSRLYGAPGDSLQLHFEVTNYREQAVNFRFGAVGELRFLRGISPTSQTIPSGQTVNVIVNVGITGSAQPGARDLITFTAYGLEQVSISAYVYVVNTGDTTTDVWSPDVRHNFQGSCIGRQGNDCAQHVWSATVIARDANGGLLRLSSSPTGLVYDSNFISGSREEVIATYRATCCAPRVMVTAVDAFGNANSYVVDISGYYTEAAIAAIVLGVFLVIALIALIVFLIYWCVKRRRESRELPSYSTSSRNVS